MASLYKPKNLKRRTVNGKRVPVLDRKGQPVYRTSRVWWIEYHDVDGRRRRVAGFADRSATQVKAGEIEKHVERQSAGILTVDHEHTSKSVSQHVSEWVSDLERSGRSSMYVSIVKARVERLAVELVWKTLGSVRADKLSAWLANERRGGASPRTTNHFLDAARAFCNWCVTQNRMETNPVAVIAKARVTEPSRKRRAASLSELAAILHTAPPDRSLCYLAACLTGLRRGELKQLEWADVHLDSTTPHIALRASTTKAGRADTVPLNGQIAGALRVARPKGWQATDRVFRVPKVQTFYDDLKRAGVERYVDGEQLDFHSLRVTFGTLLASSGAPIRVAMELMRHTDAKLTTQTYVTPQLLDTHGAVQSLPAIRTVPEQQRATGTLGCHGGNHGVKGVRERVRLSAMGRKDLSGQQAGNPGKQGVSGSKSGVVNRSATKPTLGVEPRTSALRKLCSAIELCRRKQAVSLLSANGHDVLRC